MASSAISIPIASSAVSSTTRRRAGSPGVLYGLIEGDAARDVGTAAGRGAQGRRPRCLRHLLRAPGARADRLPGAGLGEHALDPGWGDHGLRPRAPGPSMGRRSGTRWTASTGLARRRPSSSGAAWMGRSAPPCERCTRCWPSSAHGQQNRPERSRPLPVGRLPDRRGGARTESCTMTHSRRSSPSRFSTALRPLLEPGSSRRLPAACTSRTTSGATGTPSTTASPISTGCLPPGTCWYSTGLTSSRRTSRSNGTSG